MSRTANLRAFLEAGNTVTANEIKGKFKLANPHEAVRQIRKAGVMVYANPSKLYDGTPTTRYRVGSPSKAFLAAAYEAGVRA